jgi:hypothetical protein
MKFGKAMLPATLSVLFLCGAGWATPTPGSANPTKDTKPPKEKHWTGILVDVGCMTKALGADNLGYPTGSVFNAPHLAGWGAAIPQKTLDHAPEGNTISPVQDSFASPGQQQPGQPGQQGTTPAPSPRGPEPMPGTQERVPDATSAEQERAIKVNDAAAVCAASSLTQTVGLATGEGQVFKFDQDGNLKAEEALKSADVPPGKKVKAKVTGTLKDQSTVMVASIEIKRAGKQSVRIVSYASV